MNTKLFTTTCGSHAWKMNTETSDIDLFTVYIVPSKSILDGTNHGHNSHFSTSDIEDNVSHEIGKVINELIKGNINFLVGVLSPIINYQYKSYLDDLKELVIFNCQTKACANSIRGLAIHNYKKYIIGSDTAKEYDITKKCNSINRNLLFGMNALSGNGFKFIPVKHQTPEDVKFMLSEFDKSLINSTLSEKTNSESFRKYLLDIRLNELNGVL